MNRPPLDTGDGRPTTAGELSIARQLIERSGVLDLLAPHFDSETGRPRTLSLLAFLVAAQLNALHRHHRAHLVEIARVLNALTDDQRTTLGIVDWDPDEAYPRVERLFARLSGILESGEAGIDAAGLANRLARAAIPTDMLTSKSVAVDGTDVETWGALHGEVTTVDLDGEAAETQLVELDGVPKPKKPKRKAKVLGVGDDGRNQYTVDRDARAGHRSATNSRPAGPYVGYELHLAVQARDVRWTNHVDRTTLGPEVAGVVTTLSLVPAGTHRGKAIVDQLVRSRQDGQDLDEVVWDPGYSLCTPGTTHHKLAQAGIGQTFQPVTHQRSVKPFSGDALLIDGQLYSSLLPIELRDLPAPPRGASELEKLEYEAKFNNRARWRLVRHAGPDRDGVTRWKCPFCAGLLRSRRFPATMRRSRTAPLIDITEAVTCCCSGVQTVMPAELPLWQRIPFGTTAWRISMGRRQVVESINAALKGAFVDLARGFFRVLGQVKMTLLLGFTVAAFNLDRIRSFLAKQAADKDAPKPRAKRRVGTWKHVVNDTPEPRSDAPPG